MKIARIAAVVVTAGVAISLAPTAQSAYTVTNIGVIGPYNGSVYSRARDLNSGGVIVGESTSPAATYRGFRYGNGSLVDLGTLGAPPWNYSFAQGVNVKGE